MTAPSDPGPDSNSPAVGSPTVIPSAADPVLGKLGKWIDRVESGLLVALLMAMILVAVYQVVARNVFGTGLLWGDSMVRIAVLWVTMVGASTAAGTNSHINIDVVDRFAGERVKRWIMRLRSLFAAVMCWALAWYSVDFIAWDYADETVGFGIVPAWVLEAIIPVGGGLMGLKYLARVVSRT